MTKAVPRKSNLVVKQLIEHIFSGKQISRMDHLKLTSAFLSDHDLTDEDRRQINRIFDYIQTGRLKLGEWRRLHTLSLVTDCRNYAAEIMKQDRCPPIALKVM